MRTPQQPAAPSRNSPPFSPGVIEPPPRRTCWTLEDWIAAAVVVAIVIAIGVGLVAQQ